MAFVYFMAGPRAPEALAVLKQPGPHSIEACPGFQFFHIPGFWVSGIHDAECGPMFTLFIHGALCPEYQAVSLMSVLPLSPSLPMY